MSNPSKAKGTRWESQVRNYLKERGIPAYRPAQTGFKDSGDIHGVSPFIIQAKDWRDIRAALNEGVTGAVKQAANAGEDFGVAVIKRARKPVEDGYAVMRLQDWVSVLARLQDAEGQLAAMHRSAPVYEPGVAWPGW